MHEDGRVHVGLVLTGGTICSQSSAGMVVVDLTDATTPAARLVEASWVGPGRLSVHARAPICKLSEDMTPGDWLQIAVAVRELVEVDGLRSVLVFHGTDTAGYTAAALAFLLADLDATVVVTGSNALPDAPGSDAPTNVRDALAAARQLSPGVYLSFSGVRDEPSDVYLGSSVRKIRAHGQVFEAPNVGPVARVVDGELDVVRSWPRLRAPQRTMAMDDRMMMLSIHPGVDLHMMADAAIGTGKRGVVVSLYPCASGPDNDGRDSVPVFVRRCTAAGLIVVACVERFGGSDAVYPSLPSIAEAGAVFASDTIPEIALVKLSWALAQAEIDPGSKGVEALFLEPVAGESIAAARRFQDSDGQMASA